MESQKAPIDRLIAAVLESSKYRYICPEMIRRIGGRELSIRRSWKEAVKETKNTLHQVAGAYMEGSPRYARWLGALRAASDAERPAAVRAILAEHASSRERLPHLETFYQEALAPIAPVRSVLDVACGLNPLAIPWMPLADPEEFRYIGIDLYEDMGRFLEGFFLLFNIHGRFETADAAASAPQQEADVALVLKFLPVLEQTERGSAGAWLRALKTRFVLVSFPLKSLGGHGRGRADHYESWFREVLQAEGWNALRIPFDNELCFLIEK